MPKYVQTHLYAVFLTSGISSSRGYFRLLPMLCSASHPFPPHETFPQLLLMAFGCPGIITVWFEEARDFLALHVHWRQVGTYYDGNRLLLVHAQPPTYATSSYHSFYSFTFFYCFGCLFRVPHIRRHRLARIHIPAFSSCSC